MFALPVVGLLVYARLIASLDTVPLIDAGFHPPLLDGLADLRARVASEPEVLAALGDVRSVPACPAPGERLRALEALPDWPPAFDDGGAPVRSLLIDPPGFERRMVEALTGVARDRRPLAWRDAGREVWLPGARAHVAGAGWAVESSAGGPVACRRDDDEGVCPYCVVAGLARGTVDPVEWLAEASRLGVADALLAGQKMR